MKTVLCSCRCVNVHVLMDLAAVLIRKRNEAGETVKEEDKDGEKNACDA